MGDRCKRTGILPPNRRVFRIFGSYPFRGIGIIVLKRSPCPGPNRCCKIYFSMPGKVTVPNSLTGVFGRVRRSLKGPVPASKGLSH